MSMPLGLSIASHSGLPPAKVGALASAAELAGFSAVFVAEGHGDALRPPVLAAKTAAQLDRVEQRTIHPRPGRRRLGHERAVRDRAVRATGDDRGIHGRCEGRPRRSPTGYDGQVFRAGMVSLDSPPIRTDLPIYMAALGPRMLELAGRIADGVILNLMYAGPGRRGRQHCPRVGEGGAGEIRSRSRSPV